MSFDAFTVATRGGPHVTLQAGTRHAGRYWTTTTRRSVKVRAIGRTSRAAVSRTEGGRTTISAGRAVALDPSQPWSLLSAPLEVGPAGGAVARIAAGQVDQVLGYVEAGRGVPPEFMPWGRVLLVTSIEDEVVVEGGRLISARGRWAVGGPSPAVGEGSSPPPAMPAGVPTAVAALASVDRPCWLGVTTGAGPVAVPGAWRATGSVTVAGAVLAAVGAVLPGPVCCTLDDSTSRRPDRKLGCMLRGGGSVTAAAGDELTVAVEAQRISWWDGFGSGSALTG